MANIRVDTQKLRSTASELRNLNRKLTSEAATMSSNQRSLTAMWDGPSNETFDQAFNKNLNEFRAFTTLIERYSTALEDYARQYEDTERRNQGIATTR